MNKKVITVTEHGLKDLSVVREGIWLCGEKESQRDGAPGEVRKLWVYKF